METFTCTLPRIKSLSMKLQSVKERSMFSVSFEQETSETLWQGGNITFTHVTPNLLVNWLKPDMSDNKNQSTFSTASDVG